MDFNHYDKTCIPGIKRVMLYRTDTLPAYLLSKAVAGLYSTVNLVQVVDGTTTDCHYEVETVEMPSCTVTTSNENGYKVQNVTLEFKCLMQPRGRFLDKVSYIIVDEDDNAFLIGTREGHRPLVEVTDSLLPPSDGQQVVTYKVTQKHSMALIPIVLQ